MWPFKKTSDEEKIGNIDLENEAISKVDEYKNYSNDSVIHLNRIFRVYINEKFGIKQSLTFEELLKIIKKRDINLSLKEKIIVLASKFNGIEYNFEDINIDKYNSLVERLKEIIVMNIPDDKKKL